MIVLFVMIVFRLYSIQVTYSPDYTAYLERSSVVALQKNVPRGVIYDRNFGVLVDNEAVNTITYQLYTDVSTKDMKETATKLADLIEMDFEFLTSRDLKDLFIETYPDEVKELITKKENSAFKAGDLKDKDIYKLQLDRITDEHLAKLSSSEKEARAIYINMSKGTKLTSNIIKKGATTEEVAIVSEHLEYLPGVNTEVDWDRTYPSIAGHHPAYGRVSSYEQGLPASKVGYYKAHDYQANDRVGMSQLELYYEFLLRGYKSQYVLTTDNEVSNYDQIYEGQRGHEVVLTLDADLQAAVNKIVEEELIATKASAGTDYLREAYIVMMNPKTGEILSLTGKIIEYNEETKQYEVYDNALGSIQNAFTMGSAVKGVSLLAGYNYGVTNLNDSVIDTKMTFKGGLVKGSWKNLGYVNDSDALKFSSNVFFFQQTIRLGGSYYTPGGALVLDLEAFDKYRDFFAQFGLGVSTGIDLPNESIGLRDVRTPGKLLDFAIGQADIYTTLQLAQSVSTIVTNGYRYAPKIIKEVYIPSNESIEGKQLLQGFKPTLLNVVELDQKYFQRVQDGFKRALQEPGGTGYGVFYQAKYNPAGKTGTAQEYARGEDGKYIKDSSGNFIEVYNRSLVAYAPADNPEVAIAVITPQSELPTKSNTISLDIG
ncbi:MAG: peptidoglycan D,D-transpeptidase FtsI family protein, partial [Turicibacter sp.]